ncbi:MAG: hypothetical protein LBT09_02425 [Planctomycetaceae bacterium]|nr:hypothetical protein [Planctomycetaceae bacterium]
MPKRKFELTSFVSLFCTLPDALRIIDMKPENMPRVYFGQAVQVYKIQA